MRKKPIKLKVPKKRSPVTDAKKKQEDVGYGKPPKKHQFKKGVSGNPKGRPQGKVSNGYDLLMKELTKMIDVNEGGKQKKISKLNAAITKYINRALLDDRSNSHLLNFLKQLGLLDPCTIADIENLEAKRKQEQQELENADYSRLTEEEQEELRRLLTKVINDPKPKYDFGV